MGLARPCKGDGAGGVGLRPQQPPLHRCDLPADRGPHVPGGSHGSTIHGSWGACNSGTRATHARGHRPESHGLVRAGTAGEGLGGEDQAHQTQAGPSRKRPAGEAPVQALRRRRDRFHPHEIPGKRSRSQENGTKKSTVDGWDREDEVEERGEPKTRHQLERMHAVFRNTLLTSSRSRSSASSTSPGRTWRAGTSGSMVRTSGAVFPRQRTTSWQLPSATHGGRFTRRCMRATPSRRPCCRSGRTHCSGHVRSMRRSRPFPGAAHQPGHSWTTHHLRKAQPKQAQKPPPAGAEGPDTGGGQARWRPSSAEQGWGRQNQRAQRPRRDQNSHTTGTTAAPQPRATGAEGPDMAGTGRFPAGAEGPDTGGRTRKARVPDDWQHTATPRDTPRRQPIPLPAPNIIKKDPVVFHKSSVGLNEGGQRPSATPLTSPATVTGIGHLPVDGEHP